MDVLERGNQLENGKRAVYRGQMPGTQGTRSHRQRPAPTCYQQETPGRVTLQVLEELRTKPGLWCGVRPGGSYLGPFLAGGSTSCLPSPCPAPAQPMSPRSCCTRRAQGPVGPALAAWSGLPSSQWLAVSRKKKRSPVSFVYCAPVCGR